MCLQYLNLLFGQTLSFSVPRTGHNKLLMKIVIADDSSLLRDRIKSFLNGIKVELVIYEAENGQRAMELVYAKNPDLVILDIRMPEMNGIEVLKEIRKEKMKTKVCIFTNYPYPQYKKKCMEAGADYFLNKAGDLESIKTIITDLLSSTETHEGSDL